MYSTSHLPREQGEQMSAVAVERLESRQLFSGTPLGVAQVAVANGTELRITGTKLADHITVAKSTSGFTITNTGGWSTIVNGSFANLRIDGGAGDDLITLDASVTRKSILLGG